MVGLFHHWLQNPWKWGGRSLQNPKKKTQFWWGHPCNPKTLNPKPLVFSIYRGNVYINLGFLFFSNSCILTRCKFTKPLPAHKHTNKAKTRGWQPKTQEWGILTVTKYEVESHQWLKTASKAPMSTMKKSRRIFIYMKRTWGIVRS
jgi:hypothetical protein